MNDFRVFNFIYENKYFTNGIFILVQFYVKILLYQNFNLKKFNSTYLLLNILSI